MNDVIDRGAKEAVVASGPDDGRRAAVTQDRGVVGGGTSGTNVHPRSTKRQGSTKALRLSRGLRVKGFHKLVWRKRCTEMRDRRALLGRIRGEHLDMASRSIPTTRQGAIATADRHRPGPVQVRTGRLRSEHAPHPSWSGTAHPSRGSRGASCTHRRSPANFAPVNSSTRDKKPKPCAISWSTTVGKSIVPAGGMPLRP